MQQPVPAIRKWEAGFHITVALGTHFLALKGSRVRTMGDGVAHHQLASLCNVIVPVQLQTVTT